MTTESQEWLSTGQAASYCSVKSDTILKWIKRGKLHAERTAGGHYRIQRQELEPLILTPRRAPAATAPGRVPGSPLRCWEYLGGGGAVGDDCQQCIVYRSRAAWCFRMAGLSREVGHSRVFCKETCVECAYYQRVQGMAAAVLVITPDPTLRERLSQENRPELNLHFAENGYEASAMIPDFRPAFVILDHELMKGVGTRLLDHLLEDTRIPGLRVILAVSRGKGVRVRAAITTKSVVAVIEKPFGIDQVESVVGAFPVEAGDLHGEEHN